MARVFRRGKSGPKGGPQPSSRYTPPIPKKYRQSPKWVPVLMFLLFGLGALVIILNYLPGAPLLPGPSSNSYVFLGLGLVIGGFLTSTTYR